MLDMNKDNLICDFDIFENWKFIKSDFATKIMKKDLMILLKAINVERENQGKHSIFKIE